MHNIRQTITKNEINILQHGNWRAHYTVVSNTSLVWFKITALLSLETSAVISGTFVQVTGAHCTKGELLAETELSESIESLELDTLLLIDSSEELDFKISNFSLSSSLTKQ